MNFFKSIFCILLLCLCSTWNVQAQTTLQELYDQSAPVVGQSEITVNWSAPSTKTNGEALPLEQIAGYELYVMYPSGDMDLIEIAGADATSYTLPVTSPGEYSFAISTVATYGLKAELSGVASAAVGEQSAPAVIGPLRITVICRGEAACSFYLAD